MSATQAKGRTVTLIGGSGGMSGRYREVAERRGLSLRHFENAIPPSVRKSFGAKGAIIFVIVTMVSHVLRDQARELASDGATLVYLESASVSALKAAVDRYAL